MPSLSLRLVALGLALAAVAAAPAATFVFSASGLTSFNQIVLPGGMTTVVKAVNVGSTSSDTVNGITFASDTGNWPAGNIQGTFVGNGYTANAATETGYSLSGASFTSTTINILGATSGGYLDGTQFTGLVADTDYVFQLFLSDNHAGRGAHFSYTLGSTTETQDIVQNHGDVNLFQVSFNSGSATTFDWGLTPIANYHDAKIAGFAFYSSASAIPEPSTYAAIAGAFALALAAWWRTRRAISTRA